MKSFTRIQRPAWSLTALLLLMVSNVFGVTHSTHNMSPHNPDETLQYIWCVEDNWKLLVRYPGKDLTNYRKLHDWDKKPVRLYDLTKDPHETKEVSEAHPEVVARLKKTIEAWHAATRKPGTSAGDPIDR